MHLARLTLTLALAAAFGPPALAAAPLAPHRAVYDLALASASERSGITGIHGRMVYEFAGSVCDGYTVTFRFVTRIASPQTSRLTDQQTTTFEEGNGESFTFSNRSFLDSRPEREVRGRAWTQDDRTLVDLDGPEREEIELGAARFPTQHLIELLDKARAGETFYETTLFDASEDADKEVITTVVIGRPSAAEPNDPELDAIGPIAEDPFWPVEMAYFDIDANDGEEMPTYRISFKLHENGVTRGLVMDYGDFSLTGRLVDLAVFEAPACEE